MLSNLLRFPVWIGVHEECEVFSSSLISCFQDVLLASLHKFPGELSFNSANCFRETLDTLRLQKAHVYMSPALPHRKAKM